MELSSDRRAVKPDSNGSGFMFYRSCPKQRRNPGWCAGNALMAWNRATCPLKPKQGLNGPPTGIGVRSRFTKD